MENKTVLINFTTDFRKRFSSFGKKAPIPIAFEIKGYSVYVHEYLNHEVKPFYFKDNYNPKAIIKSIKDWLCEHKYPVMVQIATIESDYSSVELSDIMKEKGLPIDDIVQLKKREEKAIRWRIEKVFTDQNIFIVRNLEENVVYKYKFNMPVLLFLKKMREGKFDSFKAWENFVYNSTSLGKCIEVDEGNHPISSTDDNENNIVPVHKKFFVKKNIEKEYNI